MERCALRLLSAVVCEQVFGCYVSGNEMQKGLKAEKGGKLAYSLSLKESDCVSSTSSQLFKSSLENAK